MSRLRMLAAAATVAATALIAAAGVSARQPARRHGQRSRSPSAAGATSGGVKTAYFTQWGIYAERLLPQEPDHHRSRAKLDFLNYAFANIHPTNHTCFMANKAASQDENNPNAGDGAGDAFADYGKSYGADISVDGVGDVWNQPIQGNFNQLKKLKAKQPNLKILISIGGWTYSKYFSDAASTDAKRKAFVSSCVNMFLKGDLPVVDGFGGPGSAAGIFDGIDIDWEYPGSPNGHVGNHYSAADKQNFTLLLAEFRAQLDALRRPVPARRLPDRRHPGRPGQDRHDRDRQDRAVPRLQQRDDVRHARRLGGHRADELPGPALPGAERPEQPDPAGSRASTRSTAR